MRKMRYASNKEKRELSKKINIQILKKDEIKIKDNIYFFNEQKCLIDTQKMLIPHLNAFEANILDENNFKKIYVDNGAVSFVVKGANLMRPGIETVDDNIQKNERLLIKNKQFPKILAIGISLYSSDEIKKMKAGKVVNIKHHLNDKYS